MLFLFFKLGRLGNKSCYIIYRNVIKARKGYYVVKRYLLLTDLVLMILLSRSSEQLCNICLRQITVLPQVSESRINIHCLRPFT